MKTCLLLLLLAALALPPTPGGAALKSRSGKKKKKQESWTDELGWKQPTAADLERFGGGKEGVDSGLGCDFARVDVASLTREIWERRYRNKRPVILTFGGGGGSGKRKRKARPGGWFKPRLWARSRLESEYGDWQVDKGRSEMIVRNSGTGHEVTTLSKFLAQDLVTSSDEGPGDDAGHGGEGQYIFDRLLFHDSRLGSTLRRDARQQQPLRRYRQGWY